MTFGPGTTLGQLFLDFSMNMADNFEDTLDFPVRGRFR